MQKFVTSACQAKQFYSFSPVPGYEISCVKVIYNKDFNVSFNHQLKQLQNKRGNSCFIPKWSSMAHPEFRQKTLQFLEDYAKPFIDMDYPDVMIVPYLLGMDLIVYSKWDIQI